MTIAETILPEFDIEMQITRRVIERVPSDKGEWKPHEKSFPLGHLAQLVSWMPGWIASTLNDPFIDIKGGGGTGGYSFEPTEKLLAMFDANVTNARTALQQVTGATLNEIWHLKMGEQVLMTQPKGEAVRGHMNHFCHHRGQLTVYLRMVDVPLPMIYGPTADERWS